MIIITIFFSSVIFAFRSRVVFFSENFCYLLPFNLAIMFFLALIKIRS